MKKTTINYILYGIMAFLVIAICILLTKITNRTRYIDTTQTATIQAAPFVQDALTAGDSVLESAIPTDETAKPSNNSTASAANVLRGHTSDRVKIREQASLEARVLEIVDEGYEFTILEILSTGWTRISYEEGEAFISSAYVIVEQ